MKRILITLTLITVLTGCVGPNPELAEGDNYSYAVANRYSNCIEKHSTLEVLTYEEMKEVCSVNLK